MNLLKTTEPSNSINLGVPQSTENTAMGERRRVEPSRQIRSLVLPDKLLETARLFSYDNFPGRIDRVFPSSWQNCVKEQQYTLELFPELKEIYFCPENACQKCFRVTRHNVHNHSKTKWSGQYRKPGSGMLQLAMARHKHKPEASLYVGDRPEDEIAARRAGIPFYWAADWRQHQQSAIACLKESSATTP